MADRVVVLAVGVATTGAVLLGVVVTANGTHGGGGGTPPGDPFPFATPATLQKGVGIVVDTTLKIGNMLAPDTGSGTFIISPTSTSPIGKCIKNSGGGACLADATRNRGSLNFTGDPDTTVFVSTNVPFGSTVNCTGGTGTTPVQLREIVFNTTSSLLDGSGNSTTPVLVGAWFTVFDTSLGTQFCSYQIFADY